MLRRVVLLFTCVLAAAAQAAKPAAPAEIVFRHAMTGEAAAALVELVARYNA